MKIIRRSVTFFAVVIIHIITACNPTVHPIPEKTREDLWEEDIDFIIETLPQVHVNLYRNMNQEDFSSGMENIKYNLQYKSDEDILIEISSVLSKVKDVNTYLEPIYHFAELPVKFNWFADGLFITEAASPYNYLFQEKVSLIGNRNTTRLLEEFTKVISADNEFSEWKISGNFMHLPKYLSKLGFSDRYDRAYIEIESGRKTEVIQQEAPYYRSIFNISGIELPVYQKNINQAMWFTNNDENQYLYIQINKSERDSAYYTQICNSISLYTPLATTRNVIVDLRHLNNDKNNLVFEELIASLRQYLNPTTEVYTIISGSTYNSGVDVACKIKNTLGGILIGEPTGGRLNHSADLEVIELPNYRHKIFYPTKIIENSLADSMFLQPDIEILLSAADYFNYHDPVMDYILSK